MQYEKTRPLTLTLMLSVASGRKARPPLSVCLKLCVCLTKPISQTGVEYQNVRGKCLLPPFLEPVLQSRQSQLKNCAKY